MKRLAIMALIGTVGLLLGVAPGLAKKKPSKPIVETLEASLPDGRVLRFEIEEFSTDQDVQELGQMYSKGGKDSVEKALNKTEKGLSWMQNDVYPIRMVQSVSQGGMRNLFIVADAADRIEGDLGGRVFIGHRGYPFSFIQLLIDSQGKGKGQEIPFAAVVFNKQGQLKLDPMPVGAGPIPIALINVHTVSQ